MKTILETLGVVALAVVILTIPLWLVVLPYSLFPPLYWATASFTACFLVVYGAYRFLNLYL